MSSQRGSGHGPGAEPRRMPFGPAQSHVDVDLDAVVAFCAAHGGPFDAGLVRQLLLELTSDPAGVLVVGDGAGIALAATVVDRVRNGADAASLETLAVRAPLTAAAYAQLVVDPAVAFARAGARRALQVELPPDRLPADGAESVLQAAGFAHAFDTFAMRRPASASPPDEPPAPLPPGWSWVTVDGPRADAAHAALLDTFRGSPATHMPPLADFRRAVASGAAVWRALLDGDRIAGLVRAISHTGRGEIRVLGRVPTYRGQGLGPRLMAEGLRRLRQGRDAGMRDAGMRDAGMDVDGDVDVDLSVEAANERALGLYRRFGFEIVARTPVFSLALRG